MASVSRRVLLAGVGATAAAATLRPAFAAGLTLSNARVYVGDGTSFTGGIRVEGDKIVEAGPGVRGGEDQGGRVIFPGFYDGGSALGLLEIDLEAGSRDDAESSDAVMPQARVIDAYNPRSALIPVNRRYGVVGGLVLPAGGLVPGQAAWMRTTGDTVADAAIQGTAGVVFRLGASARGATNGPKSRMGVAARIRDLLDANKPPPPEPAAGKKAKKDKGDEKPPEEPTRLQRAVRGVRAREQKAIFVADRADDLLTALDLAREYTLDAVLVGCAEGHLVAAQLRDTPCIVGPVTTQPDDWDHLHAVYENCAVLHRAGVRFGLRQGDPHRLFDLSVEACVAVANGLPPEVALAAATGNAPSFWGLACGRVQAGHEATFVRCDGDPLQPRTRVDAVWMRGVPASLRSHQTELYERYRTLR